MSPFRPGDTIQDHAGPMGDLMKQLSIQLAEFKALKEEVSFGNGGAVPFGTGATRTSSGEPLHNTFSEQSQLTQTTSPGSPMFPIMGAKTGTS